MHGHGTKKNLKKLIFPEERKTRISGKGEDTPHFFFLYFSYWFFALPPIKLFLWIAPSTQYQEHGFAMRKYNLSRKCDNNGQKIQEGGEKSTSQKWMKKVVKKQT